MKLAWGRQDACFRSYMRMRMNSDFIAPGGKNEDIRRRLAGAVLWTVLVAEAKHSLIAQVPLMLSPTKTVTSYNHGETKPIPAGCVGKSIS